MTKYARIYKRDSIIKCGIQTFITTKTHPTPKAQTIHGTYFYESLPHRNDTV
jgi:hypothetical protein